MNHKPVRAAANDRHHSSFFVCFLSVYLGTFYCNVEKVRKVYGDKGGGGGGTKGSANKMQTLLT